MAFAMASLKRSKSGRYIARKGIPKDVRSEYERLYKEGGWEAKFSADAALSLAEAKARFSDWLAEVEYVRIVHEAYLRPRSSDQIHRLRHW